MSNSLYGLTTEELRHSRDMDARHAVAALLLGKPDDALVNARWVARYNHELAARDEDGVYGANVWRLGGFDCSAVDV